MSRILIVDDEIDTLDVFRLFLELSGYEVYATLNSENAIALAQATHPDCVLLDIMMPGLDGFSLCKMMRAHAETSNLPIMFVTAYPPMDLEDRRKEVGADMVLMKPFGMDALSRAIEALLFNYSSRKQCAEAVVAYIANQSTVIQQNAPANVYVAALQTIIPRHQGYTYTS